MRQFCQKPDACEARKPTTHCRRCSIASNNTDPERKARKIAAIKARYDRPGEREAQATRCREHCRKAWENPVTRERMTEAARLRNSVMDEKCQAASRTPETIKRRVAAVQKARFGWCPPERRAEYNDLVNSKGMLAADAKRMILETIPGTPDHGRLMAHQAAFEGRLRHEREKASRY